MKKSEENLQVKLGRDSYYHMGFPYSLENELATFSKGYHFGQFAFVKEIDEGLFTAVRDPLGIGKMFYTETPDGKLHFSESYVKLFPFNSKIFSLPAGAIVNIGTNGRRELVRSIKVPQNIDETQSGEAFYEGSSSSVLRFRERFSSRMESLYSLFRDCEERGWTFFIALSGGLDSTIIASNASQYLKSPIACTLDLGKSEDSEKSQKIATHLGLTHLVFPTEEGEILNALKEAPVLCQDFRDFNVHCAALNILLARNIQNYVRSNKKIDPDKVIVLTGDLMNEYTCDYAGEVIDGVEYYKLPRIGKKGLQNYLISGLDTSDREISPFAAFGIKCVQPFAALYDLYADLPESLLETEDPKKLLNSFQVDKVILDYIPKVKLRAQVGSRENMGILGLCHNKGISDKTFHKNIMEKSGYGPGKIPIFVGRYDVEKFV
ncbi:MAG: asparagine synthase-related protein [Spirochaetales bacterium]|nr:asparagine synthase-related protein [Spirochaetales bacterium]